ncbi:MAG: hypothetical protein E3J70_12190, partial [Candidatus Heimdallarchaeota archaeon]
RHLIDQYYNHPDVKKRFPAREKIKELVLQNPKSELPVLNKLLTDDDYKVRRTVIVILREVSTSITNELELLVPVLIQIIQDTKWEKQRITEIVEQYEPVFKSPITPKTNIYELMVKTHDEDWEEFYDYYGEDQGLEIRPIAVKLLGLAGKNKPEIVIPTLLKALRDKHPVVKKFAINVLCDYSCLFPKNSYELILAMFNAESVNREHKPFYYTEREAFEKMASEIPDKMLSIYLEKLNAKNQTTQRKAVLHLKWMSEYATTIIPELVDLLADENPKMRENVIEALYEIGGKSEQHADQVVTALIPVLQDEDIKIRMRAVSLLGYIGKTKPEQAERLIPTLSNLLSDQTFEVKKEVVYALRTIGLENPNSIKQIVQAFCPTFQIEDEEMRYEVKRALDFLIRKHPDQVKETAPLILETLENKTNWSWFDSDLVRFLSYFGKQTVPLLLKLHKESEISHAAFDGIVRIGKPALSTLQETEKLAVGEERKTIQYAIKNITKKPSQGYRETHYTIWINGEAIEKEF